MKTIDTHSYVVHFENDVATVLSKHNKIIAFDMKCDDILETVFKGYKFVFLRQNLCYVCVGIILYSFLTKHKIVDFLIHSQSDDMIPVDECGFVYLFDWEVIVDSKFCGNFHPYEYYLKNRHITQIYNNACSLSKIEGISKYYWNMHLSELCYGQSDSFIHNPDCKQSIVYDDGHVEILTHSKYIEIETEYGNLMGFQKLPMKGIRNIVP